MTTVFVVHTGGWNAGRTDLSSVTKGRLAGVFTWWPFAPDPRVLIPGGTRSTDGVAICEVAKAWLVHKGLPEDRILTPFWPAAYNTIADVLAAKAVLRYSGLADQHIVVISSSWHVPRLRSIWKKYGGGIEPEFVAVGPRWNGFRSFVNELKGTVAVWRGTAKARWA